MKRKAILLFSATAIAVMPVLGNGFYIPVQAPEATGKGNAWLATADTAAAVYYNAAGLTQIDSAEVVVGAYGIMLGLEAELDSGANEEANNSWGYLPQIYASVPVNDKLVAGFGLNTPFGLATDWDDDSQFSPLAIETELVYATGWAVLGYKLTDEFSIGGGMGLHYADLKRTSAVAPGVQSEFNGDSEALSWTLSAMWKPTEQHAVGLVYRSKTEFNLKGDFEVDGAHSSNAELEFLTPATMGVGYAYTPCKEWSLEANIEWVQWEELNSLDLNAENDAFDSALQFDWKSNFIYSVGATRYFDNGWNVSAGYNYIENSMPNETFNPGVSDATRHWLNAGVGRQYEAFRWNFAYQYAFSDRDVSGSPAGLADGTFKSRFHGLMLNGSWRF